MLDQIFGENNFQSEIIWHRTLAKGLAFTGFPNNHDTIFYYGGGDELISTGLTILTTRIISTRKLLEIFPP